MEHQAWKQVVAVVKSVDQPSGAIGVDYPDAGFGWQLMACRNAIERFFGNLTNWGGSLTCLPAWARTWKRVHRWVQAKLILNALRRNTYVN